MDNHGGRKRVSGPEGGLRTIAGSIPAHGFGFLFLSFDAACNYLRMMQVLLSPPSDEWSL